MPHNTDVTQRLAQFVAETKWDALKPPVAHEAKRALLNFFAVALTGCREPAIETVLRSLTAFSGGRQAAVIGRRERAARSARRFSTPQVPMCSTSATPMCRL
jgi:2-methylcitrate dehydratase PrpD